MDYGLSPQQITVIDALSAGATALAAAAEAGIHRNTIANWRRNSIGFQHALAHAQYDRALAVREQAEALIDPATQTIRAILADPATPASIRLRAALAILNIAATPPEPRKQVTLEFEKIKVVRNPEPLHISAQTPAPPPVQPAPVNPPQPAQQPFVHATPPPGRNELCPCGSQIKYKRCCLNKPARSLAAGKIAA
jgi:hypothetical protein